MQEPPMSHCPYKTRRRSNCVLYVSQQEGDKEGEGNEEFNVNTLILEFEINAEKESVCWAGELIAELNLWYTLI